MRKGFGTLFFIIAAFFIAAPFAYFFAVSRQEESVKGATSTGFSNGFYIIVNSSQGNWDLHQYGCTGLKECEESLFSGRNISTISGGVVSEHDLAFTSCPMSGELSYIKYFIEPGWGSMQRVFTINTDYHGGVRVKEFVENGETVYALLVPVAAFDFDYFKAAIFSD